MVYLLENAIRENLLSLQVLTDGITFDSISTRPAAERAAEVGAPRAQAGAEKRSRSASKSCSRPCPLKTLIGFIPLEHVYNHVLLDKVAKPSGFLGGDAWESARPAADKADAKAEPGKVEEREEERAAAQAESGRPRLRPPSRRKIRCPNADDDVDALIQSTRPPAEEEARKKVIDKLTGISRLPPRHESLTTPVLLSIESMYEELLTASTDECARDVHPRFISEPAAVDGGAARPDRAARPDHRHQRSGDHGRRRRQPDQSRAVRWSGHRYEQQHPSCARHRPQAPLPPPPPVGGLRLAPPPLPRSALAPPLARRQRAR